MRRRSLRAVFGWLLLAAGTAWACRYSVRDTGFVDLGNAPYRLEFSGAESLATAYRQAAAGAFLEANITFSADSGADDTAPRLRLRDPSGRSLELGDGFAVPAVPAEISRRVESVAASPAREEILRESLRSFAVVVLVEGTDPDDNTRAAAVVRRAIEAVARLQPAMPKPIDLPAHLLTLPVARQASEQVLLWGLGLDPAPTTEARAAIVYGRGRRLGSPLEGPLITRTALQERLVLVGQDCECDLDRAWMQGPVIPGRWDPELQEIAARTLGFDPENPMVRTEVGRIVLRGEGDRKRSRPTGSALALGYSEQVLDLSPDADEVGEDGPPDGAPDAGAAPAPAASTGGPGTTAAESAPQPTPEASASPGTSGPPVRVAWSLVGALFGAALLGGAWLLLRGGGRG